MGVLRAGLLDSPFPLTVARVLFELAQDDGTEVTRLRQTLDIDAGYLSRIVGDLADSGLAVRERSTVDGRRQVIRLTDAGRVAAADLGARSDAQVHELLAAVPTAAQERLVTAMAEIETILGAPPAPRVVTLRDPAPGDLGGVAARNGAVYASEYGWDSSYEALCARIVADFGTARDAGQRGWIADLNGTPVGSVFCTRESHDTARLRLLLVDQTARGTGIGSRLIEECVGFARRAGYRRIVLWTVSMLVDARRLYQRAGFTLQAENPFQGFGRDDLTAQDWSLEL